MEQKNEKGCACQNLAAHWMFHNLHPKIESWESKGTLPMPTPPQEIAGLLSSLLTTMIP